jgi:hypothetical protein
MKLSGLELLKVSGVLKEEGGSTGVGRRTWVSRLWAWLWLWNSWLSWWGHCGCFLVEVRAVLRGVAVMFERIEIRWSAFEVLD